MKLKGNIYSALKPRHRVAATVAAWARKDDAEIKRLQDTCPRGSDAAFWDTFKDLLKVGLGVESDLRGLAIDYLAANTASGTETEHQAAIVRTFASLREAWRRHARDLQIDFDDLHAASAPHHDYIEALAKHAEGKHDEASVGDFITAIRSHIIRS